MVSRSIPLQSLRHYISVLIAMLPSNSITTLSILLPLLASIALLLTPTTQASAKSRLKVLPFPTYSTTGDTPLCLASGFDIKFNGHAPSDLIDAISRTKKNLSNSRHKYLSVDRGTEFFNASGCEHYLSSLVLSLNGGSGDTVPSIMDSAIRPAEDRPDLETYTLSVPLDGPATITSKSALGVFRGLTTFEQLFYHLPVTSTAAAWTVLPKPDSLSSSEQLPLGSERSRQQTAQHGPGGGSSSEQDGKTYAPFAPYEIEDKPAFGWRAVLLDTSRHYFGVPSILKVRVLTNSSLSS